MVSSPLVTWSEMEVPKGHERPRSVADNKHTAWQEILQSLSPGRSQEGQGLPLHVSRRGVCLSVSSQLRHLEQCILWQVAQAPGGESVSQGFAF